MATSWLPCFQGAEWIWTSLPEIEINIAFGTSKKFIVVVDILNEITGDLGDVHDRGRVGRVTDSLSASDFTACGLTWKPRLGGQSFN